MGQEILYCVACQTQLRGADFDKRRAVRVDGKGYCLPCGQKLFPPDRLAAPVDSGLPPPSTRLNIKPARRAASTAAAPSSRRSLAIGGAAVLVLVGIGIAVLSSKPPVEEPPPPPPLPPKEVRKAPDPAPKPLPDVADVDAELKRLLPKEEFGQALRLIENARSLSNLPEWTRMVNQRIDDVHARAEKTLKELTAGAVEAKRAGNLDEPRRIRERLAAWEYGRAIPELDAALSAVTVPVDSKALYSEDFSSGRGRFEGGDLAEGALSVPPKGVAIGNPFPAAVPASALVRFRVKPPPGFEQLEVVMWSNTLKLNCWIHVAGLKPGEWQQVELKADQFRGGWNRDGASLVGQTGNTLRFYFDGTGPDARVLIDDVQLRE